MNVTIGGKEEDFRLQTCISMYIQCISLSLVLSTSPAIGDLPGNFSLCFTEECQIANHQLLCRRHTAENISEHMKELLS